MGRLVNPTITRHKVESFTKVKAFLDSIQRNSKQSKKVYQTGITHFQDFLNEKYTSYSTETILELLNRNQINVYELLDNFISFLMALKLSANSIQLYMAAIRSYLAYYDVDVMPSKFKRRVKMPKSYREDEEPIDAKDIRNILLHCFSWVMFILHETISVFYYCSMQQEVSYDLLLFADIIQIKPSFSV